MDRRDKLPHPRRGLWIRPPSPAVRALPRVLISCIPSTTGREPYQNGILLLNRPAGYGFLTFRHLIAVQISRSKILRTLAASISDSARFGDADVLRIYRTSGLGCRRVPGQPAAGTNSFTPQNSPYGKLPSIGLRHLNAQKDCVQPRVPLFWENQFADVAIKWCD
jgi:hypothetical protein